MSATIYLDENIDYISVIKHISILHTEYSPLLLTYLCQKHIYLSTFHCSVSFEFWIPAYSFTFERKAAIVFRFKHFIINYLDLVFQ